MFVIAQVIYELGNSFRTGTETAFIYDYITQNKNEPSYKVVKANQKIYARIGEATATALGSIIVVYINNLTQSNYGYNAVFFIAAVPVFLNLINAFTWPKIKENKKALSIKNSQKHTKSSFKEVFSNTKVLVLLTNIMIFSAVLAALAKFIQPYMTDANIPIAYFGAIYTASLIITAIVVKFYTKVEDKLDQRNMINILTFVAIIPALVLGLGYISVIGVILFFIIVMIENIRSTITQDEFNKNVSSENRATTGSILELGKSTGKLIILPIAGYFADAYSMYTAIIVLTVIIAINSILFYIRKPKTQS